jgi:hypothetical protein
MGHGVPASPDGRVEATDMNKLMRITADKDFTESADKIGGYGVGLKCGGIAFAQTVIVVTRGTTVLDDRAHETVSIGLLSNASYENFPENPGHPTLEFVTTLARNGEVLEGVSTQDEKKQIMERVEELSNKEITDRWIGLNRKELGTTVILLGIRKDRKDWILKFRSHDIEVHRMEGEKTLVKFDQHPTIPRESGRPISTDWSLRHFLSMMFLCEDEREQLKFLLFGKPVERIDFRKELGKFSKKVISNRGASVDVYCGTFRAAKQVRIPSLP